MRKLFAACLLLFLALPCFADTYVAVVETMAENGAIGRSERLFLTDKLRDRAKKVLPAYMGFVIMTRENIQQMLPPGKKIEDCEGECLVETGMNINADYIAQARVGKFGDQLTLTVEMYETRGNNLVGSFTAMCGDPMQLLREIESQADEMFAVIAGGNGGGQAAGGADGFEGINMGGSGYKASGSKSYIVSVNSNPAGAVFSVDGRPDGSCNKTPCDITLSAGSHRFSFGLKMYFDKDTVFEAKQSGQKLAVKLNPNFGELTLKPQLQSGVGSADGLNFEIDGNKVTGEKFRLAPGKHSVAISHGCYETASFNVNINNGSDLVFDKPLLAKTGGLKLDVVENGKPKALPVFVNGNRMGVTPFLETVPVCSKVTLGDDQEQVPVKLKANETVAYKHSISFVIPGSESLSSTTIEEKSSNSTFTDSRDGQRYKTVKIGNQVWMAENLNYKVKPGKQSWCYDNKDANCKKYGRLYTWAAAVGKSEEQCGYGRSCNVSGRVQGVCPSGWHLPSKQEFETLREKAGGEDNGGKILKSMSGWSYGNGTDGLGFSALPAGYYSQEFFIDEGDNADFWSSSEYNSYEAYYLYLIYFRSDASMDYLSKNYARSVRCLRNSNDGGESSSTTVEGGGASGFKGSAYFTDSRDGQRYKTVKIGNQVWMAENLNYKTNDSYCYKNDEGMCKKYGRLYTWDAAKIACPNGWHLPNDNEWNALWTAVGGTNIDGLKLKSMSGWNSNRNGTDTFGFAVLPAGDRRGDGNFYYEGYRAYFWSSTENDNNHASNWDFYYDDADVYRGNYDKDYGYSVRCLMDSK